MLSANKTAVCPNDRHLALRAKLHTGWSSAASRNPLSSDEQAVILSVIRRNEEIENAERQRIGRLVMRLEKIKQNAIDRGPNCCRLCGNSFGLLKYYRIICLDCRKPMCSKCCPDMNLSAYKRLRSLSICRICSEIRELWKKTGAWFFKGLPIYEIPPKTSFANKPFLEYETNHKNQLSLLEVETKRLSIHAGGGSSSSSSASSSSEIEDTLQLDQIDGSEEITNDHPNSINEEINNSLAFTNESSKTFVKNGIDGQRLKESLRMFGSLRKLTSITSTSNADVKNDCKVLSNEQFYNCFLSHPKPAVAAKIMSTTATQKHDSKQSEDSTNSSGVNRKLLLSNSLSINYRDTLLGWLEIAFIYKENYNLLEATIVRARDISAMDSAGLTDPFCKLNIITADGNPKYLRWQKTHTIHRTRNPEFNETIQFVGVEGNEMTDAIFYIILYDDDKYGYDFLGCAKISLSTVYNIKKYRVFVPLLGEDEYSSAAEKSHCWPRGSMLISLCYNTKKRALIVKLQECNNLMAMDSNGCSDPFVKLQLSPHSHRYKKYKSHIKWRTLNPIYNEEFQFDLGPQDFRKLSLILTVWDKDLGKSNDFLGSLVIGCNSKGERLQQWCDCIRLPDQFHTRRHCLAPDNPLH